MQTTRKKESGYGREGRNFLTVESFLEGEDFCVHSLYALTLLAETIFELEKRQSEPTSGTRGGKQRERQDAMNRGDRQTDGQTGRQK